MIRRLMVQNLAVIRELEIAFEPGLNVLTGETGAGKSVLISALGLILGGRAPADLVRTGASQAVVEGEFAEGDKTWVVRRIIKQGGASRLFINDEPVKLATLQEQSEKWIDLHGQHDHQAILRVATHLDFLDAYTGLLPEREVIEHTFRSLVAALTELEQQSKAVEKSQQQQELDQFQLGELEAANLQAGEEGRLGEELQLLAQAGDLIDVLTALSRRLQTDDPSLPGELSSLARQLDKFASLDPQLARLKERLEAAKVELDDLAFEAQRYQGSVRLDAERLAQVEERLAELETIKRKYGGTIAEAMARRDALAAAASTSSDASARLVQQKETTARLRQSYSEQCLQLSRQRQVASTDLAREIEAVLAGLDMAGVRFELRLSQQPLGRGLCLLDGQTFKSDERGYDKAEFYMSANPGEDLRPLARIASGGEVSRTMLGIKTVLAEYDPVGCLVFDEIDSGISGATADKVGIAIEQLARSRQVICITHLPQIAARGGHHLLVSKQQADGRTESSVKPLSAGQRRQEIARLLSGVAITAASLEQAGELLAASAETAPAPGGG